MAPQDVLIAHQRTDAGCLCGWAVWGASHADHVLEEMHKAGYEVVKAKQVQSALTITMTPPKPEIRYVPVPDPRQRY